MAIFASVILFTQIIPAEAAGSEARKKAEELTKQIEAEKASILLALHNAKTTWDNTRLATKTAKENFKNDPSDANRNSLALAQSTEFTAKKAYQKLLSDSKNFKAKLSKAPDTEKATKNASGDTKKEKSEKRKKLAEASSKINTLIQNARENIVTTKSLWKSAEQATDQAKKTYKNDPTSANKDAIVSAKLAEDTARQNYKNAISDFKNLKFSLKNL